MVRVVQSALNRNSRAVRALLVVALTLAVASYLLVPRIEAVVFGSGLVDLRVPQFGDAGARTDTQVVAGAPIPIMDLNLFTDITHTFSGQLEIFLTSTAGTTVMITARDLSNGSNDNFAGTTWDDEAADPFLGFPFMNNVAPASLRPVGSLSNFDGQDPNGIWTLLVDDVQPLDTGTLHSWSLDISNPGVPPIDVTIVGRDSGTPMEAQPEGTDVLFDVTLSSAPSGGDVLIGVMIDDGTAVAPGDYTDADQVLTFTMGGPTTQTVTISTIDDGLVEPDEDFAVTLSVNDPGADMVNLPPVLPCAVMMPGEHARGTIVNNDVVEIDDVGNSSDPQPDDPISPPDLDGDGVPDVFDDDIDGDGVPNGEDFDPRDASVGATPPGDDGLMTDPPPVPDLIFADGFESGDTTAWTSFNPNGTTYQGGGLNGQGLRVSGLADGPSSIAEAIAGITGEFSAIFAWDAVTQRWLSYFVGAPSFVNTLSALVPGQAVIVDTDDAGFAWQMGTAIVEEREVELHAGFNFVGWTGPDEASIGDVVAGLGAAVVSVSMLDPGTGMFVSYFAEGPPFVSDLESVPYSRAIWVRVSNDVTWTMPGRDAAEGGIPAAR